MNLDWLWSMLFIIIGICLALLLGKIAGSIFGSSTSEIKKNIGEIHEK
jgi:hypothetical protein